MIDANKLAQDGLKIVTNALSAAPGGGVVTMAVNDAAALKDILDQIVLAIPPIDASSLDPKDRAAVDAEVDSEVAKS